MGLRMQQVPPVTEPVGPQAGPPPPPLPPGALPPRRAHQGILLKLREFFAKHGKRLWWLHSVYALGLGALVVAFAQKGFDHARWLAISLSLTWLLVVLFFRLFGSGARQENVDF